MTAEVCRCKLEARPSPRPLSPYQYPCRSPRHSPALARAGHRPALASRRDDPCGLGRPGSRSIPCPMTAGRARRAGRGSRTSVSARPRLRRRPRPATARTGGPPAGSSQRRPSGPPFQAPKASAPAGRSGGPAGRPELVPPMRRSDAPPLRDPVWHRPRRAAAAASIGLPSRAREAANAGACQRPASSSRDGWQSWPAAHGPSVASTGCWLRVIGRYYSRARRKHPVLAHGPSVAPEVRTRRRLTGRCPRQPSVLAPDAAHGQTGPSATLSVSARLGTRAVRVSRTTRLWA